MRGEFLRKTEKLKGEKTSAMQNISKQFKSYFIDMGGRGSDYMLSSLIVILIRKGRICLVYKCYVRGAIIIFSRLSELNVSKGPLLIDVCSLKGEKTSAMQNISKQFKRYFIDMGGRGSEYMLSSLIVILIRKGRICLVYKCYVRGAIIIFSRLSELNVSKGPLLIDVCSLISYSVSNLVSLLVLYLLISYHCN